MYIILNYIISIFHITIASLHLTTLHDSSFMVGYHVHEKAIIIPMVLQILVCFKDNALGASSIDDNEEDSDLNDRGKVAVYMIIVMLMIPG